MHENTLHLIFNILTQAIEKLLGYDVHITTRYISVMST